MIKFFGLTLNEMGIGQLELVVIILSTIVFTTLFVVASKNLDTKGIFQWMLEKPNDWIGRK